jgi:rhodanese-related sulfurtransferase
MMINKRPAVNVFASGLTRKSAVAAVLATVFVVSASAIAQTRAVDYPKANVDFGDFKQLVADVERHREQRLIDLDTFVAMSREPGVVILDARSRFRFDRLHVEGAKHLNFSDFTQENLRQVIPTPDTTVLIYCNNNFDGNQEDFATKVAVPLGTGPETGLSARASASDGAGEPLMMALNVPTYINLYGYGYRNVYELNELVSVDDPRIRFAGSSVVR